MRTEKERFIQNDEFARQVQQLYDSIDIKRNVRLDFVLGYKEAINNVGSLIAENKNGLCVTGSDAFVLDICRRVNEKEKL